MVHFLKAILFSFSLPFLSIQGEETPKEESQHESIVLLGGGVGSLTSAIYLARAGISPLVIEGPQPGGLLTQSHSVQNWPGEMEIEGAQLTDKIRRQAEGNGARFLSEEVIKVDFSKRPFTITTRSLENNEIHQISADSCIIAMGTKPNFLGIPGEQEYWGKGVTNCAICDGSLYRNKVVGVVGGGDAAVIEALYLSNIAREVHVFVRKDRMRAVEEKRVETLLRKPNVKIHFNSVVQEAKGDGETLTGITVKEGGQKEGFTLDGLFLAIGSTPNSAIFEHILKLDNKGYIILKKDQETSIAGVYAIGDIVDPVYKQAISAAGDGAKAALQAQEYLSDKANRLVVKSQETKKVVSEVIEILSLEQLEEELASSDIPVIIDFYATWCGPCKRISPVLESSAGKLAGKVKFLKVNVDNFFDLTTTYNIKSMPTVVLLDPSGVEVERKVGLEQINDMLKNLISMNSPPEVISLP